MEFEKKISFKFPLHYLIVREKFLVGVDNETNLIYYSTKSNTLKSKQSLKSPLPHPHHRWSASDSKGEYFVFYHVEKKKTFLLRFNTEKNFYEVFKVLKFSTSLVECVVFDKQDKNFATGDNDGRVFVYSSKNGKLFASLPPRADYIASIAFNEVGNLIAYSAYDKSLSVYDLHRSKMLYLGNAQLNSVILQVAFLKNKDQLVLADRDGVVVLYDFIRKKIVKKLLQINSWPMTLKVLEDDRYVIIGQKNGAISVVLLEDESKNSEIYKSKNVLLHIAQKESKLYFVFENGIVGFVENSKDEDEFKQALIIKNYKKCYELIEKNKILLFSKSKQRLDDVFEKLLKQAIVLIGDGKLKKAQEMLKPFEYEESKRAKISKYSKLAKKMYDFAQLVKNKEYAKAYLLGQTAPFYTELPAYATLEKIYRQSFDIALQKLTAKATDKKGAIQILNPFATLPDKGKAVRKLLNDPMIFYKAKLLYKKKMYSELEALIAQVNELKFSPIVQEYENLKSATEFYFDLHFQNAQYMEALEQANMIEEYFPKIYKKKEEDIKKLKVIINFINAVNNKSYSIATKLVSINPFLIDTKEYKKLDKIFNEKFDKAIEYAQDGKFEQMQEILKPLVKNPHTKERVVAIYKVYLLENQKAKNEEEADKIIAKMGILQ